MEGLYYLRSENKAADQLRGYREADLRLCFRICKKPFFHNVAHLSPSLVEPFLEKPCLSGFRLRCTQGFYTAEKN